MDSYQLSIVLESIQLPADSLFSFEIRLPDFDWCPVGTFIPEDLPSGSFVNLPREGFLDRKEINLDVCIKTNDVVFSGTLVVQNLDDQFHARGVTVLYNEKSINKFLLISLMFILEKIRPPPPPEPPKLTASWSQTEKIMVRDAESQVQVVQKEEKGVGTEGTIVDGKQLETSIQAAVELEMKEELEKMKERGDGQKRLVGGVVNARSGTTDLGMNVVPRLQKLTVLDQMIGNRERLLGAMENTLRHSEIRRKMEFIKNQRSTLRKSPPDIDANPKVKKENLEQKSESSASSSSPSESSEQSTETSESSSESDSESTSTSSKSQGSTVIEKAQQKKEEMFSYEKDSSVEDPFSPKKEIAEEIQKEEPMNKEEPLTPTSQYLKDLRERIIRERESVK